MSQQNAATAAQKEGFARFQDRLANALRSEEVRKAASGEWKKGLDARADRAEQIAAELRNDR